MGLTEAYTDPAPGTGKTLVVTAYTVNDGNGGKNYAVAGVPNTTGVITDPATYFSITGPVLATTGSPFNVTLTAMDRFNNVATGYTGTISITSTDPAASVLVSSYTFTAPDAGIHTFSIILNTGTLASGIGTTIFRRGIVSTTNAPPIYCWTQCRHQRPRVGGTQWRLQEHSDGVYVDLQQANYARGSY